ncbi:hypothetical protein ACOSP7_027692 [Xanthoceras sorbifolium]
MMDFLMSCRHQLRPEEFQLFVVILWAIWNRRNNIIHDRPCLPVADIFPWCKAFLDDFLQATTPLAQAPPAPNRLVRWIPPIHNTFKLNTDAAMDATHNITGLGAVLRDSTRAVMLSCVHAIHGLLSPIVAEAKAILFGLSTAFA